MFAVTGIGGEVFRGSLEHLLESRRVLAVGRQKGVQVAVEDAATAIHTDGEGEADRAWRQAAAAYTAAERTPVDRGPIYHAYQVMSRQVLTLAPDAGVDEAWRTLARRGVGQAPVLRRDGRLVGLVARAHLLHVLNEEDGRVRDVLSRLVGDVMETPVVAAEPIADVRRIARVMLEFGLPALPIIDPAVGGIAGIVTRGDILRVVVNDPPLSLWA